MAARIRDLVRAHYEARSLSPPTLDRLRLLAAIEPPVSPRGTRSRFRSGRFLEAAVAALAAGLIVYLAGARVFELRSASLPLSERIAREIAMHHVKDLTPDFVAYDYESLRGAMGKLDFVLHAPSSPEVAGLVVRGGRYCSIQGRLAAQLSLEDSKGRRYTLHETLRDDALQAVPESEIEVSGASVRLWTEADLLLGLAGPSSRGTPNSKRSP